MNMTLKRSIAVLVAFTFLFVSMFSFLTLEQAEAATVKLNKTKVSLYVGEKVTLKMIGTSAKPTFTSSNKSVATVSKTGKVTTKKVGTATITAKVKGKSYKCKVTVKSALSIDKKTLNISVNTGGYIKVASPKGSFYWDYVDPDSAEQIINSESESSWETDDKGYMNNIIHISGLKEGTAKIKFQSDNQKETKYVTVNVSKEGDGSVFSDPEMTWTFDEGALDENGDVIIECGCYPAPFTVGDEIISGDDVADYEATQDYFNLVLAFNVHKKKNGTLSIKVFDQDNPDSYEILNVVFV